ncbi:helix-turn-helix domain-containing protein [Candidatus Woesearchaeota archaeon]|nr:helix-turn-helix domain-containing protein [Candidatus Woesearchaeota archaeon]
MWTAKLKLTHKESWTTQACKRHNVTVYVYPLTFFNDNDRDYITSYHYLVGEEKNKKAYLEDIKSLPRMKELNVEGDHYIFKYFVPRGETRMLRNVVPGLIFTKPSKACPDGWQYIEVAAWSKKILDQFIENTKKGYSIKFLKYGKEKVAKLVFPARNPNLSKMQEKVFRSAFELGYYQHPKRITIKQLAKRLKVSESTCREHLRVAESKIMPTMIDFLG